MGCEVVVVGVVVDVEGRFTVSMGEIFKVKSFKEYEINGKK